MIRYLKRDEIAICSQNCVQIWKGREKWFFAGWDPVKKCFLIETFLYKNKILRTNNYFCRKHTILKAKGLENSVYCTRPIITCKEGKRGWLVKCGQDMKITDTGHSKKYVFDALGLIGMVWRELWLNDKTKPPTPPPPVLYIIHIKRFPPKRSPFDLELIWEFLRYSQQQSSRSTSTTNS